VDNGHIDVLVLTQHDWANTVYRYTECLESLGLSVVAFKGEKHAFNYPKELKIHPALKDRPMNFYHYVPQLQPYAEKAKAIHYFTSTFIDTGIDPFTKNIVFQHGGTTYRLFHEYVNSLYNHFVDSTIVQTPDLLGLGADNEILITSPVQIEAIEARYDRIKKNKIVIGHFPRNPELKGSGEIVGALDSLKATDLGDKFEYVFSSDHVSWPENIKRMAKCDVIIETCNAVQVGRLSGEWGNTALEAAALGKIVITNSVKLGDYSKEYGKPALLIANNKDAVERRVAEVLKWPAGLLAQSKRNTHKWVVENHSMEATAKRLWTKIYSKFFEGEKK